jgi:DNA-binding transcriptional regulator YiaG
LTQRELADRIGVGQQVVSGWESRRNQPGGIVWGRIGETIGMGS